MFKLERPELEKKTQKKTEQLEDGRRGTLEPDV